MSVIIPPTSATIAPEYAATQISFNRAMVTDANGHLVPQFSGQIPYQRTDYVVDAAGNKLAVVQRNAPVIPVTGQDPYSGWVNLDQATLSPYLAQATPDSVFGFISTMADELIQADLVKRGLIAAPVTA